MRKGERTIRVIVRITHMLRLHLDEDNCKNSWLSRNIESKPEIHRLQSIKRGRSSVAKKISVGLT